MSDATLPKPYQDFKTDHPEVAAAYEALGSACHEAGPLPQATRHLIKLGIATAGQSRGGVKAHARRALNAGATREEIRHAILLSLTTSGFPSMIAALGWAEEAVKPAKR